MTEMTAEINEIEPEMEDIVDFVQDVGMSMHVLLAHENPYRSGQQQNNAVHWSCKITTEKHHMVVYFSKGISIRRWIEPRPDETDIPLNVPPDKVGTQYDGPMPPFTDEDDLRTFNECSTVEPPFLIEVLEVLAKDIWLVEQTGNFTQWAKTLQIQPEPAVKAAYNVVCQQRTELYALLGEEECHRLLYEIERLNPYQFEEAS
jgi:hypothetical protein